MSLAFGAMLACLAIGLLLIFTERIVLVCIGFGIAFTGMLYYATGLWEALFR